MNLNFHAKMKNECQIPLPHPHFKITVQDTKDTKKSRIRCASPLHLLSFLARMFQVSQHGFHKAINLKVTHKFDLPTMSSKWDVATDRSVTNGGFVTEINSWTCFLLTSVRTRMTHSGSKRIGKVIRFLEASLLLQWIHLVVLSTALTRTATF